MACNHFPCMGSLLIGRTNGINVIPAEAVAAPETGYLLGLGLDLGNRI